MQMVTVSHWDQNLFLERLYALGDRDHPGTVKLEIGWELRSEMEGVAGAPGWSGTSKSLEWWRMSHQTQARELAHKGQ